jgi:hypothetical protein
MKTSTYSRVPHLRDGLIVAKVSEAAVPFCEAR